MSSFSRGVVQQIFVHIPRAPWSSRCSSPTSQLLLRIRLLRAARQFQSHARLGFAAKPAPPAAVGAARQVSPRLLIEQLAAKPSPTTLYEAPSQFWYRLSSYGAGAFCVTYALVNYMSVYPNPPPGLSWWVPHVYGVVMVFMVGIGGYFVMGTHGLVRAVRAIPASQAEQMAGKIVRVRAAATPLLLEIELSTAVPFMPPRKKYVTPSEVVMPIRLSAAAHTEKPPPVGRELVAQRLAEAEKRKKKLEYDRAHLLSAPFRDLASGFRTAWAGIRRAFYRHDFAKFYVDGKMYSLDISSGWVHDRGRTLDRLVSHDASKFK